jgi:PTH1 family peptidyl-tRNA hydrolase
MMKLLAGLGNPGKEYADTRHNVGVIALEYIMDQWRKDSRFEDEGREKNRQYASYEFRFSPDGIHTEKIVVLFPQTYMNASGLAVKKYLARTGDELDLSRDLWVYHDEIDIMFGLLKIDRSASSAGHQGVQNIIDQLRTKDFVRFRIGIRSDVPRKKAADQFVLEKFNRKESSELDSILAGITEATDVALTSSIERAQSQFNKKNRS